MSEPDEISNNTYKTNKNQSHMIAPTKNSLYFEQQHNQQKNNPRFAHAHATLKKWFLSKKHTGGSTHHHRRRLTTRKRFTKGHRHRRKS